TGPASTASSPRAPFEPRPPPAPPRPARSFWFDRKPERSRRRRPAASTTSPPPPPSPPSGPPRGTYFSRRKWIEPSPPRPATAVSRARSWNIGQNGTQPLRPRPTRAGAAHPRQGVSRRAAKPIALSERKAKPKAERAKREIEWPDGRRSQRHRRRQRARGRTRVPAAPHREHRVLLPSHEFRRRSRRRPRLARVAARDRRSRRRREARPRAAARRLGLLDGDEAALAARPERDLAGAHREDRVVLADPGSGAGAEARAALADEDHPRRHLLAGEELHAEHLRVR